MNWISDVGFFALLFFLLVFIHELGHYLMAKWVGIRVEKFSIGMGPTLFAKRWGETEYRLAILPLGGYVKMSGDDPSVEYSEEERRRGFLTQKPPAKLLVVFGGPVFNLLLPIFVFALMLAFGIPSMTPLVGTLVEGGPAMKAGFQVGDRILAVNGTSILKWGEFEKIVQDSAEKPLAIEFERLDLQTGKKERITETVTPEWADGKSKFGEDIRVGRIGVSPEFAVPTIFYSNPNSVLAKMGFKNFDRIREWGGRSVLSTSQFLSLLDLTAGQKDIPVVVERDEKRLSLQISLPAKSRSQSMAKALGLDPVSLVIGEVNEGTPAFKAGLKRGDFVVSIDGKPMAKWEDISATVKSSDGKPVKFVWIRDGKQLESVIVPEKIAISDPVMGKDNPATREAAYRIGIVPAMLMDMDYFLERSSNPIAWVKRGFTQTWEMISMTMQAMGKLITGQLSLKLLGSPIMIYKVAGNSYRMAGGGHHGWMSFFSTLALLSVTLGIVNLFPIPVLDGGHATFFIIEWIRGRPLSLKIMERAMQAGLAVLICLFVVVIYNDFYRYGWLDSIFNIFR